VVDVANIGSDGLSGASLAAFKPFYDAYLVCFWLNVVCFGLFMGYIVVSEVG